MKFLCKSSYLAKLENRPLLMEEILALSIWTDIDSSELIGTWGLWSVGLPNHGDLDSKPSGSQHMLHRWHVYMQVVYLPFQAWFPQTPLDLLS